MAINATKTKIPAIGNGVVSVGVEEGVVELEVVDSYGASSITSGVGRLAG